MVGAVRGIDPETGYYFDDTKRYIDALNLGQDRSAVLKATLVASSRLDAALKLEVSRS